MKRFKCSKMLARFSLGLFLMGSHAASAMEDGGKLFGTPENAAPLAGGYVQPENEKIIRGVWKKFIKEHAKRATSSPYSESLLTSLAGDDYKKLLEFYSKFSNFTAETVKNILEVNDFVFEEPAKLEGRYKKLIKPEVRSDMGVLSSMSRSNLIDMVKQLGGAVESAKPTSNEFVVFKRLLVAAIQREDKWIASPEYVSADPENGFVRGVFKSYFELLRRVFVDKKDVIPERDGDGKEKKDSNGRKVYKDPSQVTHEELYLLDNKLHESLPYYKEAGFGDVIDDILRWRQFGNSVRMQAPIRQDFCALAQKMHVFLDVTEKAVYEGYNLRDKWVSRVWEFFKEGLKEEIGLIKEKIFKLTQSLGVDVNSLMDPRKQGQGGGISQLNGPSFESFLKFIREPKNLETLDELFGKFHGADVVRREYGSFLSELGEFMDDKVRQAIRWIGWRGSAVGTPDGFMSTEEGEIFSTINPRREIAVAFMANLQDSDDHLIETDSYIEFTVDNTFNVLVKKSFDKIEKGFLGTILVRKTAFVTDPGFRFLETFDFNKENFLYIGIKDGKLRVNLNSLEDLPNPTIMYQESKSTNPAANTSFDFSRNPDARITRVEFGEGAKVRLIEPKEFTEKFNKRAEKATALQAKTSKAFISKSGSNADTAFQQSLFLEEKSQFEGINPAPRLAQRSNGVGYADVSKIPQLDPVLPIERYRHTLPYQELGGGASSSQRQPNQALDYGKGINNHQKLRAIGIQELGRDLPLALHQHPLVGQPMEQLPLHLFGKALEGVGGWVGLGGH